MVRRAKPSQRQPLLSVWLLLAVIAVLPMGGLAYFAQKSSDRTADTAATAARIQQDLDSITSLQGLRVILGPAMALEAIGADLAPLGLSLADAIALTGTEEAFILEVNDEPTAVVDFTRERFDLEANKIREIFESSPADEAAQLQPIVEQLDLVNDFRQRASAGTVTSSEVRAFYTQLRDLVEDRSDQLQTATLDRVGRDGNFASAASYLRAFIGLADGLTAATAEVDVGSSILVEVPGRVATPNAAVQLVGAIAAQDVAFDQFTLNGPAEAVAFFESVDQSPGTQLYRELQTQLLATISVGNDSSTAQPPDGLDFLNTAFARLGALIDLPAAVSDATFQSIKDGQATSEREAQQAQQVTLAVLLGTALVALWAMFMLGRPLRRIQVRAASISAGELTDDPLGPIGPREIATLSTTLDDLSTNLRLVNAQTAALATGDTSNNAFNSELPGPIGVSLQQTLVQLNSMTTALVHQAETDSLTGLANRPAVVGLLEERTTLNSEDVGLMFIDLDRFKAINDTYGHRTGDDLLVAVASSMHSVIADQGVVGRLGGDEFVVILAASVTPAAAKALAEKLVNRVSQPVELPLATVTVGASAGIAFSSLGYPDASSLMHAADIAAYEAKGSDQSYVMAEKSTSSRQVTTSSDEIAQLPSTKGLPPVYSQ